MPLYGDGGGGVGLWEAGGGAVGGKDAAEGGGEGGAEVVVFVLGVVGACGRRGLGRVKWRREGRGIWEALGEGRPRGGGWEEVPANIRFRHGSERDLHLCQRARMGFGIGER